MEEIKQELKDQYTMIVKSIKNGTIEKTYDAVSSIILDDNDIVERLGNNLTSNELNIVRAIQNNNITKLA